LVIGILDELGVGNCRAVTTDLGTFEKLLGAFNLNGIYFVNVAAVDNVENDGENDGENDDELDEVEE